MYQDFDIFEVREETYEKESHQKIKPIIKCKPQLNEFLDKVSFLGLWEDTAVLKTLLENVLQLDSEEIKNILVILTKFFEQNKSTNTK